MICSIILHVGFCFLSINFIVFDELKAALGCLVSTCDENTRFNLNHAPVIACNSFLINLDLINGIVGKHFQKQDMVLFRMHNEAIWFSVRIY